MKEQNEDSNYSFKNIQDKSFLKCRKIGGKQVIVQDPPHVTFFGLQAENKIIFKSGRLGIFLVVMCTLLYTSHIACIIK